MWKITAVINVRFLSVSKVIKDKGFSKVDLGEREIDCHGFCQLTEPWEATT